MLLLNHASVETDELYHDEDGQERRRGLRVREHRPVKIYEPGAARYFGGQTEDISATGLRIELPAHATLRVGETLVLYKNPAATLAPAGPAAAAPTVELAPATFEELSVIEELEPLATRSRSSEIQIRARTLLDRAKRRWWELGVNDTLARGDLVNAFRQAVASEATYPDLGLRRGRRAGAGLLV